MSQQNQAEERIPPSRIHIDIEEMSSKQRKVILGLIKDLGFVPEEICEVVVRITGINNQGNQ